MRTIQHWIARSPATATPARYGPVWNPATGAQQAQVALAGPPDVDAAVQAASKAFDQWRDVSPVRRAAIMFALRDLVGCHLDELSGLVAAGYGSAGQRCMAADGHPGEFFVGPCLSDHVTTDMDIYRDEIFGPVLVVPIPVPVAFYSFGGWKDSLFGDTYVHGPEDIRFYTQAKAVTSRRPHDEYSGQHHASLHFPTAS